MCLELGLEWENLLVELHITVIIPMCYIGLGDRLIKMPFEGTLDGVF